MGILVALPIAAAIAILDRRKIEEFVFLAIGIIVSLIIVSGYMRNTLIGVYTGTFLGLCSAVYCGVIFIKDRDRFKGCVLTPGLLAGGIYMAVMGVLLIGKTDLGPDNDTFWAHAPQVLNMYRFSDIGYDGKRTMFYALYYSAPVYTSWCYFCNRLWFFYSDGINLWARQIFIISGLLPFFTFVKKGEWKKLFLILAFILMLVNIVDSTYAFMPDVPTGVVAVYGTLMTISLYRDKKKYNDIGYLIGVFLSIVFACTMKRAGGLYIFGMVCISVIYTADRIFMVKKGMTVIRQIMPLVAIVGTLLPVSFFTLYRRNYLESAGAASDYYFVLFPIAGLLMYVAIGVFLWTLKPLLRRRKYMVVLGILGGGYSVAIYSILFVAGKLAERNENTAEGAKEVFYRFFSMWFTRDYFSGERFGKGWVMSDGLFVLILLIAIISVGIMVKNKRLEIEGALDDLYNSNAAVFVGYTFYMFIYCLIYMIMQEGYTDDGMIGYAARYLGPGVMIVTAVVGYELLSIKNIDTNKVMLAFVIFLMLLLPYNAFKVFSLDDKMGWDVYNKMYADAGVELSEDDTVLCIGPDHCQYYAFPALSRQDISARDCETDPEEWNSQIISYNYNYLILEDYDRKFPETYQDMFEGGISSIKEMAIYDIVNEDGTVKFVLR